MPTPGEETLMPNADGTPQPDLVPEAPKWHDIIPEYARDWEEVGDDPNKFFDWVKEARSSLGQSLRIPSEDAGDDAHAEFKKKLMEKVPGLMYTPNEENPESIEEALKMMGMPSEAGNYHLPELEGVEIPEQYGKDLQELAFRHKLTRSQATSLMSEMIKEDFDAIQASKKAHEESVGKVRSEWGADFDNRVQAGIYAAEATGAPPEVIQLAKDGNANGDVLKWLYSLSQAISGEKLEVASQINSLKQNAEMTPREARERIQEMYDAGYMSWDGQKAKDGQERMIELLKIANRG